VAAFTYAAFVVGFFVAASALFAAHRLLGAAMIAALPAAGTPLRLLHLHRGTSGRSLLLGPPLSLGCGDRPPAGSGDAILAGRWLCKVVELPFLPLPSIRRSQLPSRTPTRFAPLTRAIPSVNSGAEQAGISGFKRQVTHGCQPQIDRRRSKTAGLQVQAIAQNDGLA
jgi:hypothetical protein